MLDKNEIVLEAWLVTRRFPTASGKPLLANNDINLKFSKGKTLGLVGESGCGKSTFMRFLVSLDRPSQGEILHREQDITKLKGGGAAKKPPEYPDHGLRHRLLLGYLCNLYASGPAAGLCLYR